MRWSFSERAELGKSGLPPGLLLLKRDRPAALSQDCLSVFCSSVTIMQLTIPAWLLVAAVFKAAYVSNADNNSEASAFYVLCADFGYLQADSSGEINFVRDSQLASQFVHDEGTLALSGSSEYSGSVLNLQFGQRLTLGTKDSSSTRWVAHGDNLLHSEKEAARCDSQSSSLSVPGIQIGVEALVQAATSNFCKQNCLTRIAIE